MNKFLPAGLLYILCAGTLFFWPGIVPASQAADTGCTWRSFTSVIGAFSENTSGGCQQGEKSVPTNEESRCLGNKPEGSSFSQNGVTTINGHSCCCGAAADPVEKPKFIMPELQVKIPGLTLSPTSSIVKSEDAEGNYRIEVPWIAEYIKAAYDYGLSIAGILAALVLMAGGVLWLVSGGDASKTGQAKEMIVGSVTGLVILACSYIILVEINPELTKFKAISLGGIKGDSFEIAVEDQETAPSSAASSHGVPTYFQCSEEGKSLIYGNCNPPKNICATGCGVVSTMMAINKLGGSAGLTALTQKVIDNGGRVCGSGSNIPGLKKTAQTYGLKSADVTKAELESKLNDGHAIVVLLHGEDGNCPFTKGGHYVVLTGWRDKEKRIADVNDPNNAKQRDVKTWTSIDTLSGCKFAGGFYLYK